MSKTIPPSAKSHKISFTGGPSTPLLNLYDTVTLGFEAGQGALEGPGRHSRSLRGENGMNRLALAMAVALTMTPASAQTNTSWDGTWNGSWGGTTAAKIIIGGGSAVEYDYRGAPQQMIGETTISGNTLSFGTPPSFVIILTRTGPTTASAHYHGPAGEADALLTKQ